MHNNNKKTVTEYNDTEENVIPVAAGMRAPSLRRFS